MRCPDEETRLSAWLDGELPEAEARAVEAHLVECSACRELADGLRELRELVVAEVEPDPGFVVRFRARRDEVSIAPWWTWRELALRLLPIAAAVLVAAVLSVLGTAERGDLSALELAALDSPVALSALDAPEPVLSIALEPFPADAR